jgi:Mg/Co/Ni transporter MgtE
MTLTTNELLEKIIERIDEVDLIELLDLTTEEIVYAFLDKIEERKDQFLDALDLIDEEEEEE